MKQKTRSLLLFVIAIIFVVTLSFGVLFVKQGITAFADSSDNYSDSYENIEDCIEKDSVIITLTENETKKYKTYTADDFKEVGCVEVEDLTQFTTNSVEKKAHCDSAGESMLVETENYKKILKLTLNKSGADNVINAIGVLNKREDVLVAGPNYIYTIASTPNDTYWNMDGMWGLKDKNGIKAESAWDITTGVSTVTVGVLDTGIQGDHPDLVNRISTEGLHRDCTVNPITTVSNSNLKDPNGHGTHVAGIIGAQGNNSTGISGVCWDVRLVSLRVFDENGDGNTSNLVRAIDYAARTSIPILNYSGGGYANNYGNDIELRNALENYKGLFVCAAGNGGEDKVGDDNDTIRFYPSDYSYNRTFSDRVISVGAINLSGFRMQESNYGAKSVSLYAPGWNILSTYPTSICAKGTCNISVHLANGYHYSNGTSMATPFVTGVAALLLSKNPNLTAAELKETILLNADDIEINVPNRTDPQKVKKLNAYNALISLYHKVTFEQGGFDGPTTLRLKNGDKWPTITMPTRQGYYLGQYKDLETNRTYYDRYGLPRYDTVSLTDDLNLVGSWVENKYNIVVTNKHWYAESSRVSAYQAGHNDTLTFTADEAMTTWVEDFNNYETRLFSYWEMIRGGEANYVPYINPWYTVSEERSFTINLAELVQKYYPDLQDKEILEFRAVFKEAEKSCVAEGTLITLANGEQVPVEMLTGDETLLVWNLFTGTFDTAPILCVDRDSLGTYEVINLYFSDDTQVKVISEHAFWNFDLNKYVYLDKNASEYIGHWFNKQTTDVDGNFVTSKVQLTSVVIQSEYTVAYSPVTYGHLCYYVDGMLSMPGGISGLFNIFDVDSKTMSYDKEAMAADIEQYGLFTYEEFAESLPVSQELFEAVNGQYLKVAIGKGLIDLDTISKYINQYSRLFG